MTQELDFDNWDSFVEKFNQESKNQESIWIQQTPFTSRDQDYIKLHILSMVKGYKQKGEFLPREEINKFEKVFKNPYLTDWFMLVLWYELLQKFVEEWFEFEQSLMNLINNPTFDNSMAAKAIDTLLESVSNTPFYRKKWEKHEAIARRIAESENLGDNSRKTILLREDNNTIYLAGMVARLETTSSTLLVEALESNSVLRKNFDTFDKIFKEKSIQGAREKYSIDETVPDHWVTKTMNWGNVNEH